MFSNEFVPKNPSQYCCEKCDYLTCSKKDYNKHINTTKHKTNYFQSQNDEKKPTLECLCSKKYKDKAVRGTPKNWAYNRCIKKNSWERCKNLPPQGWGMHRYFCE